MSEIRLRSAEPNDARAIEDCLAEAYADALREINDMPDVTSEILGDIATHQVLVVEDAGHVLGVIVYGPQLDAMMIFNLGVSPKAQGRGVARQLLDAAEEAAKADGLSVLRLRTHRLMSGTRAMYLHLGWQEFEAKGNTVLMEKQLK